MPQVTITYKKPETLKILKNLAKELDFQVSAGEAKSADADDNLTPGDKSFEDLKKEGKIVTINGVSVIKGDSSIDASDLTEIFSRNNIDEKEANERLKRILVPGDPSIDDTDLKEIFSGRNIDAKKLRKQVWERKR